MAADIRVQRPLELRDNVDERAQQCVVAKLVAHDEVQKLDNACEYSSVECPVTIGSSLRPRSDVTVFGGLLQFDFCILALVMDIGSRMSS